MICSLGDRIDVERRFLAAVFLWPSELGLSARDFQSPQHGVIFECLQDAYRSLPWLPVPDGAYDDIALAIILHFIGARAAEIAKALGRALWRQSEILSYVEEYFVNTLMSQRVTAAAIPDLIAQVRLCPRCGR